MDGILEGQKVRASSYVAMLPPRPRAPMCVHMSEYTYSTHALAKRPKVHLTKTPILTQKIQEGHGHLLLAEKNVVLDIQKVARRYPLPGPGGTSSGPAPRRMDHQQNVTI